MKTVLSLLALVASSTLAQAQSAPVGLWKTIDDETKAEKSTVRISEVGGVLSGKVEKVFDATKQDADGQHRQQGEQCVRGACRRSTGLAEHHPSFERGAAHRAGGERADRRAGHRPT